MEIKSLIFFCGIQIFGLLVILLRKKFHTIPNYLLIVLLANIIIHYTYYYLYFSGIIEESSTLGYTIVPFATLSPLLVYYYVMSVLYGRLRFTKISLLHLIPITINGIIFLFFINSHDNKPTLIYAAKNVLISLYILYPLLMIKMINNFYEIKGFSFKVFKFNKNKTSLVRLLIIMMTIHFCILITKNNLYIFGVQHQSIMSYINISFLLILGYALSYIVVSEPKTLCLAQERQGLGGFKKYEKSKLTKSIAKNNISKLNTIMETEKPYLNSEFNMSTFSKLSGLTHHEISETLNGLIGQTFNDYVNNYRVEEFKQLATKKEYKNFSILALSFEAGFKSKSTFNASFKKITGETPSQYLKTIQKDY